MRTHTEESQGTITPEKALTYLEEGNRRFVQNLKANRNLLQQVNETKDGQFPFAVVLSCIDSRVSTELVFDQGLGDIFSVRIAGNFVNEDILGSMEFACKVAGSKLIMVMGHSKCGAISGAIKNVELGNLTGMLAKIKPAVEVVRQREGDGGKDFVQHVAEENVHQAIANIKANSPVLNEMLENGEIGIVGAMYNIETGEVVFQDIEIHNPKLAQAR